MQDFRKGGSFICRAAAKCSAQRRVVQISPRKARKFFSPLFFITTASSRCKRIAGPGAAMCFRFFVLLKFRSCNVIHTYIHVSILDRGLVPKPFGFSQELQCNGS